MNADIDANLTKGEKVNLVALGINNGWFDSIIQEKAYVDFSVNNSYRRLISEDVASSFLDAYRKQCLPELLTCDRTGTGEACRSADDVCFETVEDAIQQESGVDYDVYDIRRPNLDPEPPRQYLSYLKQSSVLKAIGARTPYVECAREPAEHMYATGDGGFIICLINFRSCCWLADPLIQRLAP